MNIDTEPQTTDGSITVEEMEKWLKGELPALTRDGHVIDLCPPPNYLRSRLGPRIRVACESTVSVEPPEEQGETEEDDDQEGGPDHLHPFWD